MLDAHSGSSQTRIQRKADNRTFCSLSDPAMPGLAYRATRSIVFQKKQRFVTTAVGTSSSLYSLALPGSHIIAYLTFLRNVPIKRVRESRMPGQPECCCHCSSPFHLFFGHCWRLKQRAPASSCRTSGNVRSYFAHSRYFSGWSGSLGPDQLVLRDSVCSQTKHVRFDIFMVETTKNIVFWDMMSCGSCKKDV
jgi:hypothetical protein